MMQIKELMLGKRSLIPKHPSGLTVVLVQRHNNIIKEFIADGLMVEMKTEYDPPPRAIFQKFGRRFLHWDISASRILMSLTASFIKADEKVHVFARVRKKSKARKKRRVR